jgi:hypothetical protein
LVLAIGSRVHEYGRMRWYASVRGGTVSRPRADCADAAPATLLIRRDVR